MLVKDGNSRATEGILFQSVDTPKVVFRAYHRYITSPGRRRQSQYAKKPTRRPHLREAVSYYMRCASPGARELLLERHREKRKVYSFNAGARGLEPREK
jgi:hypothetical protein